MREEGIEPPTAGTGIQRSTTELFPRHQHDFHTTTNTCTLKHTQTGHIADPRIARKLKRRTHTNKLPYKNDPVAACCVSRQALQLATLSTTHELSSRWKYEVGWKYRMQKRAT